MSDAQDKKDALIFLREAYQNLKDAYSYLDGSQKTDVKDAMQKVDMAISTLKTQKFTEDFKTAAENYFTKTEKYPKYESIVIKNY
jgi:hypothetical protein